MSNSSEVIRQYIQDAISAEQAFEGQFRSFAQEGDDEEVQLAFAEHADDTRVQIERLKARIGALEKAESKGASAAIASNTPIASLMALTGSVVEWAPTIAQVGSGPEERLVQNLITAFCIENGECAMYEALATIAHVSGDGVTESLARDIQAERRRAADKIFRFIPSRSKIAFNVLTPHEIDPAIETKVADNPLI